MITRSRRWSAIALTIGLSATGCALAQEDSSESNFEVLTFLGLGAPYTELGKAYLAGENAAADLLNARGGINGRPVKITAKDTACDATKAVAEFQNSVIGLGSNPDVLIPGCSGETLALLPQTTARKIFTVDAIGATEVNDVAKYPYQFNVYPEPDTFADVIVAEAKAQGYNNLAHIAVNDTSGKSFAAALNEQTAQQTGMSVNSVLLDPAAVDAAPNLLKLQSAHPDALVISGTFGFAPIFQGLKRLSWNIPVLADLNMAQSNFVAAADPEILAGIRIVAFPATVQGSKITGSEAYRNFRDALTKHIDNELQAPLAQYVHGYNSIMFTAAAFEAAGTDDAVAAAEAAESGTLPPEITKMIVGPADLGISPDNHAFRYQVEDFLLTTVTSFEQGQLVP